MDRDREEISRRIKVMSFEGKKEVVFDIDNSVLTYNYKLSNDRYLYFYNDCVYDFDSYYTIGYLIVDTETGLVYDRNSTCISKKDIEDRCILWDEVDYVIYEMNSKEYNEHNTVVAWRDKSDTYKIPVFSDLTKEEMKLVVEMMKTEALLL